MKRSLYTFLIPALCSFAVTTQFVMGQGRLDPAGPPAPSMKTLEQIEPRTIVNAENTPGDATAFYRITQPGSYCVTNNIHGVAGKYGIVIAASRVTLDLGGFEVLGVGGAGVNAFDGIYVSGTQTNISIHNGSVANWGKAGVEAINARSSMLFDLRASTNRLDGLRLGQNGVVRMCVSRANGSDGIYTGDGCKIENCTAAYNASAGISTLDTCLVLDCTARNNGDEGIEVGDGCSVKNCAADLNATDGIETAYGCTVSGCSARRNSAIGIEVGPASTVTGCSADDNNGNGFRGFDNVRLFQCAAARNGTNGFIISRPFDLTTGTGGVLVDCTADSNAEDGINAGMESTVRGCLARENGRDGIEVNVRSKVSESQSCSNAMVGIRVSASTTVKECTVLTNRNEGILISDYCVAMGNHCDANAYGVRATGRANRIELNHVSRSQTMGIQVNLANGRNIVVKNSAWNNTGRLGDHNYAVPAGNFKGPIITVSDGADSTLAAAYPENHAWANFGDPEEIQ